MIVRGRVVATGDGAPISSALVSLRPGQQFVRTDSAGRFQLSSVKAGRYFLEVMYMGRLRAADSVTIGDDGLSVLAALASVAPDVVCARPGGTR